MSLRPILLLTTFLSLAAWAGPDAAAADTSVTWTIREVSGGGTVSGAGVYTAPTAPGTYHVVVTSQADPTVSSEATLMVGTTTGGGTGSMPALRTLVAATGTQTVITLPSALRYVALQWQQDQGSNFDYTIRDANYGIPTSYTIDYADGATGPWTTAITVNTTPRTASDGTFAQRTGNSLRGRVHRLDLGAAHRYLRFNITGGASGSNVVLNAYDAANGATEAVQLFGDSIAAMSATMVRSGTSIGAHVSSITGSASKFPAVVNSGIGFDKAAGDLPGSYNTDGRTRVHDYLATSDAKYVALAYGTNDAGASSCATITAAYRTMVDAILAAGKTPILPTVIWTSDSARTSPSNGACSITGINAALQAAFFTQATAGAYYGKVLAGPDLYGFFSAAANRHYITTQDGSCGAGGDGVHPSCAGQEQWRVLWAQSLADILY